MGSDSNHPFDLPDPPAENGREPAIRKAVAAFDQKYLPGRQAFLSETRLRSSTENGSVRSRRGTWMKQQPSPRGAAPADGLRRRARNLEGQRRDPRRDARSPVDSGLLERTASGSTYSRREGI